MSTDRPERFTARITELWNDRTRPDSTPDRSHDHPSSERLSPEHTSPEPRFADPPSGDLPSSDRPPDRSSGRPFARFTDLEPLTPTPAPPAPANSVPAASTPGPSLAPVPSSNPGPTRVRSWAPQPSEPTPRAVGSPLPIGSALAASLSSSAPPASSRSAAAVQPGKSVAPGRSLPPAASATHAPSSGTDAQSGFQRAVHAVRATLPFIQRILPLLDGNVGTAVANLMAPPPHRPAPPAPPVDLAPLEEGISSLQTQQRELRTQIADQNTSLKRVEDQLEAVREATDRNTLEQQELFEDLKSVGNKVNIFAIVALLLLVGSVTVNVILYLHIKRVLP